MPGDDDNKENVIYAMVFFITIVLFLFVGYQGYQRYIRKPGERPKAARKESQKAPPEVDDGYDRAPSSLPPLRVDGGVMGGVSGP
ncbi:MAG: hypothetical protein COB53_07905 [Elusimicrobia bacterium]|nr:MAG: hypothetical protein COB53_07905 [Elusimicrobiota bacterium]